MIASYAAFMTGRSFQVLGDGTASGIFREMKDENGGSQSLFEEGAKSKNPMFLRAAEDIFTCALPWMKVPEGDGLQDLQAADPTKKTIEERCMAGKRKYEKLNIGAIKFIPWEKEKGTSEQAGNNSGLQTVAGGFAEKGREPLRYGIIRLPFRMPIPFKIGGDFGEYAQGEVFVPVLLNPGLRVKLVKNEGKQNNDFENTEFEDSKSSSPPPSVGAEQNPPPEEDSSFNVDQNK